MQAETQHQALSNNNLLDFDWDASNKQYHINKLTKIMTKFHYRNFLNHFRSYFYQSLKIQALPPAQSQSKPINDWPYMALIHKVNKSQHQILQVEFINMCAEKIQTVFKGYLQRKRYRLATEKLKKFVGKARAVLIGWKTRQIMKIVKLKEEMKIISIKRSEVIKQQQIVKVTNNTYSLRKLQYLKRTLDEEVKQFSNKFQYLFKTGSWVFQPKIAKNQAISVSKWKNKNTHQNVTQIQQMIEPVREDNYHISQIEEYKTTEKQQQKQPPKAKRVREMRDRNKKVQPKPSEDINKEEDNYISTKNTSVTDRNLDFPEQERPIQAKGSYQFQDLPNDSVPENVSKVLAQKKPVNTKEKEQTEDIQVKDKKIQEKQKDKIRMQKRQKYDPRKAILEQKLKKKEQLKMVPDNTLQDKIPQIKPLQKGESQVVPSTSKQKVVISSKSQKVISKGQKQEISNRSTVNLPKAAKNKVQAKIDCWGNRKTNKKPSPNENNRMTYKSIHAKQQQQEFQYDNKSNKQSELVVEPRSYILKQGKQKERQQEYQIKGAQWRKDNLQQIRRNQMQLKRQALEQLRRQQFIKQQQYANIHREVEQRVQIDKSAFQPQKQNIKNQNVSTPLREKLRLAQQQRQRELHKSIQQLQQVYSDQYQNRYQRLIPKLGLLAAARQKQSKGPIPVLLQNSNFMKKKTVQNFPSNIFWVIASKIERSFKEFNRS